MDKPASQPVEVLAEFPNGPAIDGKSYMFKAMPEYGGQNIICMSEETWTNIGTQLESMRHMLKNQDRRIKELLAENEATNRLLADNMSRLNALREVRRAEKRADICEELGLPNPTST